MKKNYECVADFVTDASFVRYCFGQNEEDVLFWENWLKEHPEKLFQIEQAKDILQSISIRQSHDKKSEEWSVVKERFTNDTLEPETSKLFYLKRWFRLTAVVLLLIIGSGVAYWLLSDRQDASPVEYSNYSGTSRLIVYQTKAGESQKITLPDSTEVWLNADSKLSYTIENKQFKIRRVSLIGEAYFKVRKNSTKPFVVHTQNLRIRVLGTEFNIDAYPDALSSSATLMSGAIQVNLNKSPEHKIQLKPKEKITFSNGEIQKIKTNKMSLIHADSALSYRVSIIHKDPLLGHVFPETAWMKGKLAFRNEDFEVLALQMSHKYGVRFRFENDSLKGYRFTGVLTNETLEQALNALQLTSPSHPFSYEIQGRQVLIKKSR